MTEYRLIMLGVGILLGLAPLSARRTMTVVIEPGPASRGMASGVMEGSSSSGSSRSMAARSSA